jgi:hypothetical protein
MWLPQNFITSPGKFWRLDAAITPFFDELLDGFAHPRWIRRMLWHGTVHGQNHRA